VDHSTVKRVNEDTEEMDMSVEQRSASRAGKDAGKGSGLKKIVAASMVGTVVEWYEFFLYATAATLVFGKYFFPSTGNELDGIIQAFITYAVGFVARPLGGIVFGQIGDKLGRKPTLQLTIVIVGVSTFLMGCLPGFVDIGYWAPAMLVALRFIQGFALGGEWGGAVLLVPSTARTSHAVSGLRGRRLQCPLATCWPLWSCSSCPPR
jgi:MFS family permease